MTPNSELDALAQHAAECNAKWDQMEHTQYGENLYTASAYGSQLPKPFDIAQQAKAAVDGWYLEYCLGTTDIHNVPPGETKGHFTQVVWKSSIQLGMGFATTKKGSKRSIYIAGRYTPTGNFIGQEDDQVGKLMTSDKEMCPNRGGDGTGSKGGKDGTGTRDGGTEGNGVESVTDSGAETFQLKWEVVMILGLAYYVSTAWLF